jgi:hypothetical protein
MEGLKSPSYLILNKERILVPLIPFGFEALKLTMMDLGSMTTDCIGTSLIAVVLFNLMDQLLIPTYGVDLSRSQCKY